MSLSPQWLDELRARTTLSALIGKSIKITRAGREWKACCPFHNEKTPSFTINDDKGFYHCFGCGAHGDAIRWMTDQRGLSFMDAVKELAASAGLDVPAPDPRAAARAERQHSLRDVTEAAAQWYRERLADEEGADARAYLQKRGLTRATVVTFGIGFAPDARGRLREALTRFGDAMAIESGMLIQPDNEGRSENREPYDRFRGRLMIPIRDARGRTIAFGGRILGAGEPKYLNSPDTPLFDKGRILYNLDRAASAARNSDRLIIVEGYMDAIALAQAGIGEAVAPLGTALTEQQIELAWRQVPVPILAFDGDAAGQRAALRAAIRALPMLRPGHSLSFVALPAGKDPDDLVRAGGRSAFDELADQAVPLVELLWRTALTEKRDDTPEARAAVRARLMDWAATIQDRDIANLYRQAFRERLDGAFFAPRAASPFPANRRQVPRNPSNFRGGGRFEPERAPSPHLKHVGAAIDASLGDAIIAGLLRYPECIAPHSDLLQQVALSDSNSAALLNAVIDTTYTHQGLDHPRLMTILADSAVYNKAQQLLRADRMGFSFTRADIAEGMTDLQARARHDLDEVISTAVAWPGIDQALADATQALRERLDDESFAEQRRLLQLKAEMAERLATLRESGNA